jgi:monofunctional biosynthetic peptidoglycan transglycosylase
VIRVGNRFVRWRTKLLVLAAAAFLLPAAWLAWEAHNLPGADEIRSQLFLRHSPASESTWVPLWAISHKLQTAVVTWEDPAFFHHSGLDYPEIARAAWADLRAGSYRRGGSTITQQVAKNLFLTPEKTLRRKLREVILTRRLERDLSKEEILTLYLNIAEWGDGVYGADAASRHYFGKPASELDWAEAALLAGILPNPREWNPCHDPARAQQARHGVLSKLLEMESLTPQELSAADITPLPRCAD